MLDHKAGVCLLTAVLLAYGIAGTATADTGARPMGMGGAFVAVSDDAYSTYWNPAGLASAPQGLHLTYSGRLNRRNELGFNDFFGLAFSYDLYGDVFGIGFGVMRDRTEIQLNGMEGREKDRHFYGSMAYRRNFDMPLLRSLSLGGTVKALRKEWSEAVTGGASSEDDSTFSYDLGMIWDLGGGFSLGLMGRNINEPDYDFRNIFDEKVEEWANLVAGAAWRSPEGLLLPEDSLILSLDVYDVLDESRGDVNGDLRLGAEWVTGLGAAGAGGGLVLRGGGYHVNNSDLNSWTCGVGFRKDGWSVDYTLMEGDATDNRLAHIIGLGYTF